MTVLATGGQLDKETTTILSQYHIPSGLSIRYKRA